VHKERWQVAVYHEGLILNNISIEADDQKLINHLSKRYGNAQFHCVYESCAWGFHLCRALHEAGMNCIIVNPADIAGTDKERKSKTDKVDARKLASHLASGLLNPIHVPTEKLQKQRSFIRLRKKIWGDLVRAKNRLRGELRFQCKLPLSSANGETDTITTPTAGNPNQVKSLNGMCCNLILLFPL
jgi:transposase